jgi:hypothetical protein
MRNPIRAFVDHVVRAIRSLFEQFFRRSPFTLLGFGIALSIVDSLILYLAARRNGVLQIEHGVGLLKNYGLISTIVGNSVAFYLVRKYYDCVNAIGTSDALVKDSSAQTSTMDFENEGVNDRVGFIIAGFLVLGAVLWLSNFRTHVFGDPEARWGHKVFDSTDHFLSFLASRIHNVYTLLIIMPFVGSIMVAASFRLNRMITVAAANCALKYDLLNPDQRGGFGFVDRANIMINVVVVLVYIQITLHIETFKMNAEHVVGYIILTVFLISINRVFMGGIYATIKGLRLKALNTVKDKAFNDDKMSFEILKYCYERRMNTASVVSFLINPGALITSGVLKLWPLIAKAFH